MQAASGLFRALLAAWLAVGPASASGENFARGSCTAPDAGECQQQDEEVIASSVQMLQQGLSFSSGQGSVAAAVLAGDSNQSTSGEDMALLQRKASIAHPDGPPQSRGSRQASVLLHESPEGQEASSAQGKKHATKLKSGKRDPVILAKNRQAGQFCGYDVSPGFMAAMTQPKSDDFMLDIGPEMERSGVVRFMVTAMAITGTFSDAQGYLTQYAYPQEDIVSTMFEMRLGDDDKSVDVYYPQVEIRTSDNQSSAAVKRGMGTGWFDTLSTYYCPGASTSSFGSTGATNLRQRGPASPSLSAKLPPRKGVAAEKLFSAEADSEADSEDTPAGRSLRPVIVDGGQLLKQGFYTDAGVMGSVSYRLLSVKSFANNVDITAEFLMPDGFPYAVGFSLVRLQETPMTPRVGDDRLMYFTQQYQDLGWHSRKYAELPNDAMDRTVNAIWRYNISALPDKQIKIYVDPTVPERWREDFRAGIETWNSAFALVGRPDAVNAIVPGDKDWPADYEVADARFNTISWVISSQVVSMGIAKVDPRSGEILKSDIVMSDGWVRSWLGDLDLLAPNFTHNVDFSGGFRHESIDTSGSRPKGRAGLLELQQELQREIRSGEAVERTSGEWGKKMSLLSTASGKPLGHREMQKLLGVGLRHIVAHETGHILGLRHNFKGSMGISYECTRNASCTAIHGFSTSVMDYVPTNLPSLDGSGPEVDVFSQVIGAYDKLAIRYGYMAASDEKPGRTMELVPELRGVLEEAEEYETCYDQDRGWEDPTCAAYDLTSEPLRYIEDQLDRLALVQKYLLNASVLPGGSYKKYGESVLDVLSLALGHGLDAANWLGGVTNHYAYRHSKSRAKVGRQGVPAAAQRKALELMLRIMRSKESGLLPPEEGWPFLIEAVSGNIDSVVSLDVEDKVRVIATRLMDASLGSSMLARMHDFEQMTPAGSNDRPLSVGEYLSILVSGVIKKGLSSAPKSDWDLHAALADGLAGLYKKQHSSAIPDEVTSHVLLHLRGIYSEVDSALTQVGSSTAEDALRRDHLLALRQKMASAVCTGGAAQSCEVLQVRSAAPRAAHRPLSLLAAAAWGLAASAARAA